MTDAVTTTTTTAPAPPATPAEAATKLATLRADAAWGEKVLKSDPAAISELRSLSTLIAKGDDIDRVMSGEQHLPDVNIDGKLSLAKVAGEIPALRESGLSDGAIRELLSDRKPTPEEVDAVRRFKNMRHSDDAWIKRYLANDFEAVRESRLISMILMNAEAA